MPKLCNPLSLVELWFLEGVQGFIFQTKFKNQTIRGYKYTITIYLKSKILIYSCYYLSCAKRTGDNKQTPSKTKFFLYVQYFPFSVNTVYRITGINVKTMSTLIIVILYDNIKLMLNTLIN